MTGRHASRQSLDHQSLDLLAQIVVTLDKAVDYLRQEQESTRLAGVLLDEGLQDALLRAQELERRQAVNVSSLRDHLRRGQMRDGTKNSHAVQPAPPAARPAGAWHDPSDPYTWPTTGT